MFKPKKYDWDNVHPKLRPGNVLHLDHSDLSIGYLNSPQGIWTIHPNPGFRNKVFWENVSNNALR